MNMKNIFSILAIAFLCLTSCNNIEETIGEEKRNDRVYISANLSEKEVNTRAISIPATHQLRCIIEVWTKGVIPILAHRDEIAVEAGAFPTFNFGLSPGDYKCLMWADIIEKGAEPTEKKSGDITYNHFPEVYYTTDNLHNIVIKENAAKNLFNTDLCDAFFACIDLKKNDTSISEKLELKRPFAKLIVKENEIDKLAELQKMKVVYNVPSGFDVSTGEPLPTTLRTEYEKEFRNDATQILFTNYIFASSGAGKDIGKMSLLFTTDNELIYDVKEGTILIRRNEMINASGNLITSGIIKPDEPIGDPQVGDYFFIDGKWGTSLTDENKEKCIGIIFALGPQEGDNISVYGEAGQSKAILGYVMALKNTGTGGNDRPFFYASGLPAEQKFTAIAEDALVVEKEKFNGYANTKNFLESGLYKNNIEGTYPALTAFDKWNKAQVGKPLNASDWYIPSFNQLIKMVGYCYGYSNYGDKSVYKKPIGKIEILGRVLKNAISTGIAEDFVSEQRERPLQCSTICEVADIIVVRYDPTKPENVTVKTEAGQGFMRPVLTILK